MCRAGAVTVPGRHAAPTWHMVELSMFSFVTSVTLTHGRITVTVGRGGLRIYYWGHCVPG